MIIEIVRALGAGSYVWNHEIRLSDAKILLVTIREAYFLRDDSTAAPVIIAIQNVLGDEPKSLNC